MKDSGIEWIGEIPEDWAIRPLKYLFSFDKGLPITKADLLQSGVKVISYGQVHAKYNKSVSVDEQLYRYVSYNYLSSNINSLVEKGDFIFADTSEDIEGAGDFVYVDKKDVIFAGYHSIILRHRHKDENKYLAYLFLTNEWKSQIQSRVCGIKVFSISRGILAKVSVLLPKMEEQQRIADYLDKKCAAVDRLMENQRLQIEKLKEYKQSVITEAVTRGLDKTVPLKSSGVEWIGDIPEKWNITRIKYVCLFNPSTNSHIEKDEMVGYVPMECVKNGYMENREISIKEISSGLTCFANGDIIMAKVTPCFENGNIAIVSNLTNGIGFGSSELFVFRPTKIYSRFLFYFLRNNLFMEYAKATMTGTGGLKRVSPNFIRSLRFACPCEEEQQQIAEYLDKKCAEIDELISIKQQKIEKLTEYKKSLIYEYVTGKK